MIDFEEGFLWLLYNDDTFIKELASNIIGDDEMKKTHRRSIEIKEEPRPLKCLFCGKADRVEGWTVCQACYDSNKDRIDRAAKALRTYETEADREEKIVTFGEDY